MLIQVAIVDDEKQALDELENCLDRYSKEKGAQFAVTRFTSSVDFLEKYSALRYGVYGHTASRLRRR